MEIQNSNIDNDVNGDFNEITSSGRDSHVLQVKPDRHQTTVSKTYDKNKYSVKIATWNVRTLMSIGKFDDVKREMERMNISILGLSEVRWQGAGEIQSENHKIIYSGGNGSERGVAVILDRERTKTVQGFWTISDRIIMVKLKGRQNDINIIQAYAPTSSSSEDEIENFYADMDSAMKECKFGEVTIVMGDFNAKVGNLGDGETTGKFGLGDRNERGDRLVEWAESHHLIIGNTWFRQPPRCLWTWRSPGNEYRNQIDFIMIQKRFRNSLLTVKTRPSADAGSDHVPVVGKFRIKFKKIRKAARNIKLDIEQFKNRQGIEGKIQYHSKEQI